MLNLLLIPLIHACMYNFATIARVLLLQMVDEELNIKEKVQKLLTEGEYDKKRARTMDMDDFLG